MSINKYHCRKDEKKKIKQKYSVSFQTNDAVIKIIDAIVEREFIESRSLLIDSAIEKYLEQFKSLSDKIIVNSSGKKSRICSVSLSKPSICRLESISDILNASRSNIIKHAIYNLCLEYFIKGSDYINDILKPKEVNIHENKKKK